MRALRPGRSGMQLRGGPLPSPFAAKMRLGSAWTNRMVSKPCASQSGAAAISFPPGRPSFGLSGSMEGVLTDQIRYGGWIWKLSSARKKWQKRYLILMSSDLLYGRSPSVRSPMPPCCCACHGAHFSALGSAQAPHPAQLDHQGRPSRIQAAQQLHVCHPHSGACVLLLQRARV